MWLVFCLFVALIAAAFVLLGGILVYRLAPEDQRPAAVLRLWPWFAKGCALPMVLWALMNLGISFRLQPFMPSVQNVQNSGGPWFWIYAEVMAAGLFAVSTYWLAVTLGWTLFQAGRGLQGETWANFRSLCFMSVAGMALPALMLWFIGGWMALGLALASLLLPIAGFAPSILRRGKVKPMYSAAIARLKFGKYAEAEWEIIRQLESAENDFDGWLMLAELYATQFRDLAEAEKIVLEICEQPKVTPSQIGVALQKLADWQLKIAGDPVAARRALGMICDRLPGTHLARMAQARSAQLPVTADELREQRTAPPVPMPALGDNLDAAAGETGLDAGEAARTANQLSERLTRNPDDIAVRERLARLLAEPVGDVDAALEQVELLLGMAGPPDSKRAEWLGLMAAWQLRLKQDPDAAREILQRLVRDYAGHPQAIAAQRRLNLMNVEKKREELRAAAPPKIKIVPD